MKNFALFCIKIYQKYISKFLPNSCRYYPCCSEYAIWQFKNNNVFLALFATLMRILKCNQLFKGGIDYPIICKKFNYFSIFKRANFMDVDFWFIPCRDNKFYVIKTLDSLKGKY